MSLIRTCDPGSVTDPTPPVAPEHRHHEVILVVDDDDTVRDVVVAYLSAAGFTAIEARDGHEALARVAADRPDLVLLDLSLPGVDGLEVFRRLRHTVGTPVIMVTARGEEPDRILGFEVGADDYVAKPFSPRELILRVRSVLRRSHRPGAVETATGAPLETSAAIASSGQPGETGPAGPSLLVDGDLTVDLTARRALRGRRPLSLTAREFDLLSYLMANPAVAFSREQLMHAVWGWEYGDQSTVTVHVRRLREKIEPEPQPTRIVTVWGVGYRWDGARGGPA